VSTTEETLADLVGLARRYVDQSARDIDISPATRRAVLTALGIDLSSAAAAQAELARLQREAQTPLPPLVVVTADMETSVRFKVPQKRFTFTIALEDGERLTGSFSGAEAKFPSMPAGYHRLTSEDGASAWIFCAPDQCYRPSFIDEGIRSFGIAAQVYSLGRDDDYGIGDLGHVFDLAQGCGSLGADLLGLSPLHALFPCDRSKVSPYSPSSRFFIDPIYIDPAVVAGARGPKVSAPGPAIVRRLVDFHAVWETKSRMLRDLWEAHKAEFCEDSAFRAFLAEQGDRLRLQACFDALSYHFAQQGLPSSNAWPAAYRDALSPEVKAFSAANSDEILYWSWLQWVADTQLHAAASQAMHAGMEIGLYRDLAVGADLYGSEAWSDPGAWCTDLSVGAPPDPLGPKGQDWGLPPLNPRRLIADGLATFRALVAANMRHAGAIRIDHAFQLQRLFVIPRGRPASEGAYLDYPFEAMLAVLRIESHRANCAVIAEDLGNGPKDFSARIMRDGIFSYRIVSFERTNDGSFVAPHAYPPHSLASINTHDLPTFAGWWRGLDIDLRECFGVYSAEEWRREKAGRKAERAAFLSALHDEHLTEAPEVPEPAARSAALRYLARTSSALAIVSLEDAGGELSQPNIPGLADGYPNWRRRLNQTIDTMLAPYGDLAKTAALLAQEGRGARRKQFEVAMQVPRATYRLQLNRDFTLQAAAAVVPKLKALGISHLYLSPITAATAGSTHGYDVINPSQINPELGGRDAFNQLIESVQQAGMGVIVDIVPNHMSASPENPWWASVLEMGPASPCAAFFDIDWHRHPDGKLVLPVLPKPCALMLESGEIKLHFEPESGRFVIEAGPKLPVAPRDYGDILRHCASRYEGATGQVLTDLARHGSRSDLAEICRRKPKIALAIDEALDAMAATQPDFVADLLNRQHWRAVYWRSGRSDINYRRFFEIDSLAGLRIESAEVFDAVHALTFDLVKQGLIQGLRIDHIDGLADPYLYLERLQRRVGPGFYVVVEKILGVDEVLPNWPAAGTTGYDALRILDGVFLDPRGDDEIDALYAEVDARSEDPHAMLISIKTQIVETSFAPELGKLVDLAQAARHKHTPCGDISRECLRVVLRDFIAHLRVYRTYFDGGSSRPEDLKLVEGTIARMRESGEQDPYAIECLIWLLLGTPDANSDKALHAEFRTRLQQLSGPVMAKAQEDTLFYRHHRLVVRNEVGGEPMAPTMTLAEFHAANARRRMHHPATLVATSTHDTKRGEDTRARLTALAQHPILIKELWQSWMHTALDLGYGDVEPADHFMAFQNVLGAWPLDPDDEPGGTNAYVFADRIGQFLTKALREGKLRSSWTAPRTDYEARLLKAVLAIASNSEFQRSTLQSRQLMNTHGMWISLSRTVLKCTVPGIPDFYQGCEGWDLSLVDPDNRRPVPFDIPMRAQGPLSQLIAAWPDGRVKCELTRRLLTLRASDPDLFAFGSYEPIQTEPHSPWILFRRCYEGDTLIVAVMRYFAADWEGPMLPPDAYEELATRIELPAMQNMLVDNSRFGGTASSWPEFSEGLPFCIMRSTR
jgi:(1->4)-alpha-D-glucan 1-alpha-D-glucosylmutase